MPATVRDIARLAEVSPATVSRALTRPSSVAEATRDRILEVAQELGYQRSSRPARTPVHTSPASEVAGTGSIGIVVPDLYNPTFASLLKAAQHRLAVQGYTAFFADSDRQGEVEIDLARSLVPKVDGLVICSPLGDPDDLLALGEQVPLLLVDGHVDGLKALTIEYADGMAQAVNHLASLGHRRIAYAGGRLSTWSEQQRREGLTSALATLDLAEFVDLGHFYAGIGGGYAAADQLLATDATAIICINTFVAVGLMNRLAQRGISVPHDVSVIEFDAATTNQLVSPMLTTVAPSQGAVGQAAADAIIQLAKDGTHRHAGTIPVELSIQQSTTAPHERA